MLQVAHCRDIIHVILRQQTVNARMKMLQNG